MRRCGAQGVRASSYNNHPIDPCYYGLTPPPLLAILTHSDIMVAGKGGLLVLDALKDAEWFVWSFTWALLVITIYDHLKAFGTLAFNGVFQTNVTIQLLSYPETFISALLVLVSWNIRKKLRS